MTPTRCHHHPLLPRIRHTAETLQLCGRERGPVNSATRVEYQMTRWLSLLSTVSAVGRSSASVRVSKDY